MEEPKELKVKSKKQKAVFSLFACLNRVDGSIGLLQLKLVLSQFQLNIIQYW